MPRASPPLRADVPHFETFHTRWRDNDASGHINDAGFYERAYGLVNGWLIRGGGLAVPDGPAIAPVAKTSRVVFASLGFPDPIEAGLRLDRAGTSSIARRVGLFRPGAPGAAALVRFTHVFVERPSRRPRPIPPVLRTALEGVHPQVQSGT